MSFSMQISNWADKSLAELERRRRNIILALFRAVILDTPVAKGRLRGNWQISSGKPKSGELKMADKSGQTRIKRVQDFLDRGVIGKDQAVFLTNNLPYAYRIEFDGWSKQKAPEGMVRKNVIRISNNLSKAANG